MPAKAELTLLLRPGSPLPALADDPHHQHLSHAEMLDRHAAHPRIRERLTAFAADHHLRIVHLDCARRVARLSGSPAEIAAAFPRGRGRTPKLPASLREDVEAVLGLLDSPKARRRTLPRKPSATRARTALELAQAYDFPTDADAAGQTIGLIEFGGGFHLKDIQQFCQRNKLPLPQITVISVHGAKNAPAPTAAMRRFLEAMHGRITLSPAELETDEMQSAEATVEVTMDLELLTALAPGARIVVYFAPQDQQGWFHGVHKAIFDQRHAPSVLSISWGLPETSFSPAFLHSVNRLLEAAAHLGITVCASSGDAGALNGSPDGLPAVNFPASSPFCLACGGTTTHFAKRGDRVRVLREAVWNSVHFKIPGASGGGVSRTFATPRWQRGLPVPLSPTGHAGRGVPDVAAVADPRFGCELLVAGRTFTSAGTSAVAPLWAALIARYNNKLGRRCGHLNAHLYRLAAEKPCLRPVIQGSNGAYQAAPGWNPCTGYGTPIGTELLRSLQQHFKA